MPKYQGIENKRGSSGLTGICKWLKSSWIDKFPEICEGRTVRLGSRPFTLISGQYPGNAPRNIVTHPQTSSESFEGTDAPDS